LKAVSPTQQIDLLDADSHHVATTHRKSVSPNTLNLKQPKTVTFTVAGSHLATRYSGK